MRNAYTMLAGNLKGRNHFGDLEIDGRVMILKLILKK
jgi:hypothetical protein